jgi:hypothetical protein
MIVSLSLTTFTMAVAAFTVAVFLLAVVRFTTHGHGRHSAETLKCWPPFVRGRHADAPVTEPAEITFRVNPQSEAVA